MRGTKRVRQVGALATLAASTLPIAAGCGDDGDSSDDGSATSTTATAEASTTTVPVEQEVEEAYLAYWAMLDRLAQNPDPDDPEIPQRATGAALEEVTRGLIELQNLGRSARPGPDYGHVVRSVDVSQKEATVQGCVVDDSTIVDDETGEPIGGGVPAVGYIEASLVRSDSQWRVNQIETSSPESGVTSCND